jgi:hypothetical protein
VRALLAVVVAAVAGGWTAPGPLLYEAACDRAIGARSIGRVADRALDEISGIVASRSRPGVLWAHNDSGDEARVYAVSVAGRLLQTVDVDRAVAVDWEDIAIGPGPRPGLDYLYIGDLGDNDREREAIAVYRFPEPQRGARAARATPIALRYPDGPHDAEALLVDPLRKQIVVLTKRIGGAGIYEAAFRGGMLRRAGSLPLVAPVTAADVAPLGDVVAVRTYLEVVLWRRPSGEPLRAAFRTRACRVPLHAGQGEALAFSGRGRALVAISEGVRSPIVELRPR